MSRRAPSSVLAVAYLHECFICEGLQCWLQAHVMADLSHDLCCEIPQLIMSDGREASSGAGESMINREGMTTHTIVCITGSQLYQRHRASLNAVQIHASQWTGRTTRN